MELGGKAAVVTGAASGIGRGIARALATKGCDVFVADLDLVGAQLVADELAEAGVRTHGAACDVSDRAAVESLADEAWERFGHIDILVNNAGVFPGMCPTIDIDEATARWVLEVNVMGVWFGCAAFGRRFVAQGTPAHILNTGSENSLGMAHTGAAFYTASKHAVLGLSDVMRDELPEFIGVSVLCPGVTRTDLSNSLSRRPDRFGGPGPERHSSGAGLDADDVGRAAVAGIQRGDFYIVTHPPVREIVDERFAEISAAFDAHAPRFDGDDAINTRKLVPSRRSRP